MKIPTINDTKALASFWRCTPRTIQNWRKKDFLIEDVFEMAHQIARTSKMPKGSIEKAQELLVLSSNEQTAKMPAESPQQQNPATPSFDFAESDEGMTMRAYRDKISRQMNYAYEVENWAMVRSLEPSLIKANEMIMKEEAHLKKMGLDNLDVINREALERLLYQLVWSIVRGADATACKLSKSCVKLDFEEEVYFAVHPILMNSHYAVPILSMVAFSETVGFPAWVVDVIKEAFAEFHELGDEVAGDYEKVFKQLCRA